MLTSVTMAEVIDPETAVLHIPKMIRQDQYGYRTSVDAKDIVPLIVIPLKQDFKITKNAGQTAFTLKRFSEGYYVCSCPAWKFSSERDKLRKTCTHLKEILGEEYETERIALAKEAKSTVWEPSKFRRTVSDGLHARHTQAKNMLDKHFEHLSQSQPTPSSSSSPTASKDTAARPRDDSTERRHPHSTPAPKHSTAASKEAAAKPANDDSDTEEEEESLLKEAPQTALATPTKDRTWSRRDPESEDDDLDSVQTSPSKRSRSNRKNDDDDQVSLLLAKNWQLDPDPSKPRSKAMDPTDWWISEKLDGVRAFWDGHRLYSRQKLEWNAPAWWKNRLPKDITLDGELWMSRGAFDQTSQICRTTVRMGRLRTFKHFLERDSMERQWLREQRGGKLASQERLRLERSSREALQAIMEQRVPLADQGERQSWKGWKKAARRMLKTRLSSRVHETVRLQLAQSFLSTLFNESPAVSGLARAASTPKRRRRVVTRCPRCGKRVEKHKSRRSAPEAVTETMARSRPQNRTDTRFLSSLAASVPATSLPVAAPITSPTNRSHRMPHPYSTLNTSRSLISLSHVCRRVTKSSSEWNRIKFMIFDSPSMGSRPVEERWAEIEKRFGSTDGSDIDSLEGPQIRLVHHVRCQGRDHLTELMQTVESKGGEGLMLRQPGSRYEGRRGTTLYKLKSWYDAEAELIGYADGSGKHEGKIGSLVARMQCGTVFRVGTGLSDAQREHPPPIGSIINYRFFELSEDGYPRFPAFRGVAADKSRPKDALVRPRASMIRDQSDVALRVQKEGQGGGEREHKLG